MKIYCSCCDKVQPVRIDNCRDAKTNEPFQDIVCAECDLVIASGIDIVPPEQEPVAWMTPTGALYRTEDVDGCFDETHIPLYTTPPQPEFTKPTSDHCMMENAQGDLERIKLVQTGVGIGKRAEEAYKAAKERGWVGVSEEIAQPEPVIDKSAAVRIATALGWEPKRKPLTDEQIQYAFRTNSVVIDDGNAYMVAGKRAINITRAIEAAHGIKE